MIHDGYDLTIIGAGAAGLMAAAEAGRLGAKVLVLDGQREPGLKILMSGGGRCNVTNARVTEKDYCAGCGHTLKHVLKTFTPREAVSFFEKWGAPLTLLETGEFFSADDKAKTVRDALVRAAKESGAEVFCSRRVKNVVRAGDVFNVVTDEGVVSARTVLVATGGLSYPATGSDGAGFRIAQAFGHKLVPTRPALTPLVASKDTFAHLSGIALPVRLSLWAAGKKLRTVDGPLLFTHHGFSGPAAMEMSRHWIDGKDAGAEIRVDFLPMLKGDNLDGLWAGAGTRSLKGLLSRILTERVALLLLNEAKVDGYKHPGMSELSHQHQRALEKTLRAYILPVGDTLGYAKAEVTAGGVDLKELKGAALESRLQEGLFFAGEVLDVDGRIGGFNLQWAWASGVAAARAAVKKAKA